MARQPKTGKPDDAVAAAAPPSASITVRGPKAGRWRAGLWFGPTQVSFQAGDLSADQLAALDGDPLLTVTRAE